LKAPRVSVCVPTYNGAAYLGETLRSLVAQSYGDFELLVVDDASTDETLDVAAAVADARLVVHRNPRRLGLPGNWNRCLSLCRGEYVKFVFQDDTLVPRAVEALVRALDDDPDAALAFSRREIRHEGAGALPLQGDWYANALEAFYGSFDRRLTGRELVAGALETGRDLTVNVVGEPSFTLIRREAARRCGAFDTSYRQLVDWEYWLRLACGSALVFVDEPLGTFRVHAAGASALAHRGLRVRWEFLKLLRSVRRQYGDVLDGEMQARLSQQQWRCRRHLLGQTLRSAVGLGSRPPY
jgi:glycosyltransferase involved in cell wall biosynthesis